MSKNLLSKEEDCEFKKLAAVYAYACNHSTPSKVEEQERSIYNMIHGLNGCAPVLKNLCEGSSKFGRLYEEHAVTDVNGDGSHMEKVVKPLFSPNRATSSLASGKHIQLKWLCMKYLNGDCNDLCTRKYTT